VHVDFGGASKTTYPATISTMLQTRASRLKMEGEHRKEEEGQG
jgi:hypothetical protein